jgi:uncharacterized membrane protein YsdA (DUF1294 family)
MSPLLFLVYAVAAALNIATFLCFWWDKASARAGMRRIPERDLLSLAAFGGSPAALLARTLLRHKTRKEPFSTQLQLIAALQLGAVVGLGIFRS